MNRKEILREYIDMSLKADLTLEVLEEQEHYMMSSTIECFESKLSKLNRDLAEMEDANPWITKVLTVLELDDVGK
jgi:hypothetical protein